jgi:hypothetical protein
MAEETAQKNLGPKKRLTKSQAIGVMITGGVLVVIPWLIASESGSALQMVKMGIGLVGFVALCLGSYYRP